VSEIKTIPENGRSDCLNQILLRPQDKFVEIAVNGRKGHEGGRGRRYWIVLELELVTSPLTRPEFEKSEKTKHYIQHKWTRNE